MLGLWIFQGVFEKFISIQHANEIGNKKAEALLRRLLERLLPKHLSNSVDEVKDFNLRSSSLLIFSLIFGPCHTEPSSCNRSAWTWPTKALKKIFEEKKQMGLEIKIVLN